MTRYIFTLSLAVASLTHIHAQSVNHVPLKDLEAEYVHIMGDTKILSDKITLIVDAGQERNHLYSKPMKLMDATGKEMLFNSMIEALNFMTRNGYELVQAFPVGKDDPYGQYLLRKRKKD